ncbi:MAG: GNAT family N-acetyltransferase [Chloroflexi bacterium]|nr:GNAT family N-acetyltransferase [Chloroflexota bacterium]
MTPPAGLEVRQGLAADWDDFCRLLDNAALLECYDEAELVWRRLVEGCTWLVWQGRQLAGAVQVHAAGHPFAHLSLLAVNQPGQAAVCLAALLGQASQALGRMGATAWAFVGRPGGIARALCAAGFTLAEEVVELKKDDWRSPSLGNPQVQVRPASPADLSALLTLDEAAFTPLWRNDPETFRRYLTKAGCFTLAELAGEPLGYLTAFTQTAGAYVVRLAVHPLWHGQGVGTRLLAQALATFGRQGVSPVLLNTQQGNQRAKRLYAWFGFAPSGRAMLALTRAL